MGHGPMKLQSQRIEFRLVQHSHGMKQETIERIFSLATDVDQVFEVQQHPVALLLEAWRCVV